MGWGAGAVGKILSLCFETASVYIPPGTGLQLMTSLPPPT